MGSEITKMDQKTLKEAAKRAFVTADANNDGKVTVQEFQEFLGSKHPFVAVVFALLDKNGNGSLDQKEFTTMLDRIQNMNGDGDIFDQVAFLIDENGDGKICKNEMKKLSAALKAAGRDSAGVEALPELTPKEFAAELRKRAQ